eukprot:gnl/Chilomastix_caulleri/7504.p1 GENE.gnl/Chilomastix_caulleri/7504~~gnl/Chilomastix_caulleri/7504.p1  ORF type:complete len:96 (+),score=4.22 gnl/Chilomastix_caulleri/7504:288-575(+)
MDTNQVIIVTINSIPFTAETNKVVSNAMRNSDQITFKPPKSDIVAKPLSAQMQRVRKECYDITNDSTPICFHRDNSFTNEKWLDEAYSQGLLNMS